MRKLIPNNNNGRYQLRWTYQGKRYSLTIGVWGDPVDKAWIEKVASDIHLDCLTGRFDPSLDKYQPAYRKRPTEASRRITELAELWKEWIKETKPSERNYNNHHKWVEVMLKAYGRSITLDRSITDFVEWGYRQVSITTFNRRLGYIRACCKWGIEKGYIEIDPCIYVKTKRDSKKKKIKPFTQDEIDRILKAFQDHPKYNYYYPYTYFLFATGVRPSEAIGLQWKHIDFSKELIEISEVLARDEEGRSGTGRRIRKETKTGNVRYLSCKGSLKELLLSLKTDKAKPDSLVFTSIKGGSIDERVYRNRPWKEILAELKIEYRRPYTTRHTMVSTLIEKGIPITGIAYLVGHTDTSMINKVYGHMISMPELPELLQPKKD